MITEDLTSEGFMKLQANLLASQRHLDILTSFGIARETIRKLPIGLWSTGNFIFPIYKDKHALWYVEVLAWNPNVMVTHFISPKPFGNCGYLGENKEQPLIVCSNFVEYMITFQEWYDNVIFYVEWVRPWILDIKDYVSIYWLHRIIGEEIQYWPKNMKSLDMQSPYTGWDINFDNFTYLGKSGLRTYHRSNPFIFDNELHYLFRRNNYFITCMTGSSIIGNKYFEASKSGVTKIYFDNGSEWTVRGRPMESNISNDEIPMDFDDLFKEVFDYLWHAMNFLTRDQTTTLSLYIMYQYVYPWLSSYSIDLQIFTKFWWQKKILRDVLRKIVPTEDWKVGPSTFMIVENNGNSVNSYAPHILIDSLSYDKNHYMNWIPFVISPDITLELKRDIDMRPSDYLRDKLFAWALAYKPTRKRTANLMYGTFEIAWAKRTQLEAMRRVILQSKEVLYKCRQSGYSWGFRINATNWAKKKSKITKKEEKNLWDDEDFND